ncbi:NADH:ubiquinone oxidoreductase [Adlercreutzia sp. ZJ242]|uniref:NADH-quinone oxidoreductase subunit B family protein n=1 Tax=Adlercreutzia sp. ZJ242 TaxID=2709409 RepID=UPI0013EC5310|nr:NADH:ubiquinone oxidoreductase [Adlercreutzia sp. ZJ242]
MQNLTNSAEGARMPRVVFVGLASCFGCQINITNAEAHLVDVLGQIDLRYWQLTHSEPMPEEFDVAVVEGAVTTEEAVGTLLEVRRRASAVISIGACAATAGIPGMAAEGYLTRPVQVYGEHVPEACGTMCAPRPVSSVIDVDFEVACCPVDPLEFVRVLQQALYGSNSFRRTSTLCGECKRNERGCFYGRETLCLGMVTRSGCGARCPNLGRPCNGCAGLSPDANVPGARRVCERSGVPVARFDEALEMFNQTNPAISA